MVIKKCTSAGWKSVGWTQGGVAELPAGACPIFPAMAHQVENVGDKEG